MQTFDITSADPIEIVKAVYSLSIPRGLGFLHAEPGELTDEEVKQCIDQNGTIRMDYVKGRGCKFFSKLEDGKRLFRTPWYDHTDHEANQLLHMIGVLGEEFEQQEHGPACDCSDCRRGRLS